MKIIVFNIKISVFALLFLSISNLKAQNCFQIEDIMVDACGAPEAENERVTIRIGNSPLNVANLNILWPNNAFLGICQNAGTATTVAQFNSGIQACGYFVEPVNGVLPANKRVMIFTSENVSTVSNIFPNLNDTVVALFQCGLPGSGHFANYNSTPTTRTMVISFSSPAGCADTATYNVSMLLNINGGFGGNSSVRNGSSVSFINNNVSYYNNGCSPTFVPVTVDAGSSNGQICPGSITAVIGNFTGLPDSVHWSGGNGTFATPNFAASNYLVNAADAGGVYLYLEAFTCSGNQIDSVFIDVPLNNPQIINPVGPYGICNGQAINISVSGGGANYSWNGVLGNNSQSISLAGTYEVSSNDVCYQYTDTIIVTADNPPLANIQVVGANAICAGDTTVLIASGGASYLWNGNNGTDTLYVTSSGNYTLTSNNSCGSATQSVTISSLPATQAVINSFGINSLCPGDSLILSGNGGTSYLWSDGSINNSMNINQPGNYWVAANNICGIDTAFIQISMGNPPNLSVSPSGPLSFCVGNSVSLTANGASNFIWSNGNSGATQSFSQTGTFWVSASNTCGTDTVFTTLNVITAPAASYTASGPLALCPGQTLTLSATPGLNNLWNGTTMDQITISQAGTYTLTSGNQCGSSSISVVVTQSAFPSVSLNFSSPQVLCPSQSILANAISNDSLVWNNGNQSSGINITNPGNYYVVAINQCGMDTVFLQVNQGFLPVASIDTSNGTSTCIGNSLTFTGSGGDTFSWSNGNPNQQIQVSQSGVYFYVAQTACGEDTAFVNGIIIPLPIASFSSSGSLEFCPYNSPSLTFNGIGNVYWYNSSQNTQINLLDSGRVWLAASNQCGTDTLFFDAILHQPLASFVQSSYSGNSPLNVSFENTGSQFSSSFWDFGNGFYANTESSANNYLESGIFSVSLVNTDGFGCSDTAYGKVEVLLGTEIFYPNAFTPNENDKNEVFKISAFGVSLFTGTIYDRWGKLLYIWDDVLEGWDGKLSDGSTAMAGSYIIKADIILIDGTEKHILDSFVLLR